MRFQRMLHPAVLMLCVSSMTYSAQAAPVETQATQTFITEMERMNPRVPQLKEAISNRADINARANNGYVKGFPALHIAVWGNSKLVKLLVDEGANVNVQDKNGDTAMAIATECGQIETVLFLLDNGANPNIRNVNGRSVLGKARYTLTRPALSLSHKEKVKCIIDILNSKNAEE